MLKDYLSRSVIAGVSSIVLISAVQAEPTVKSGLLEQRDMALRSIKAELGLSDQQTIEWGRIQDKYIAAHARLYEEQNRELNSILTDAQIKKYEMIQERSRKSLNSSVGQ